MGSIVDINLRTECHGTHSTFYVRTLYGLSMNNEFREYKNKSSRSECRDNGNGKKNWIRTMQACTRTQSLRDTIKINKDRWKICIYLQLHHVQRQQSIRSIAHPMMKLMTIRIQIFSLFCFFFLSSTIHCPACMCLIVCSDVVLHFHSLPRPSIFVCRMFFIFVFFVNWKIRASEKKLCAKLIQNNLFCSGKWVHSVPFTNRVVNRCR